MSGGRFQTRTAIGGPAIVTVERHSGSVRLMINTIRTDGDVTILNLTAVDAAILASFLNPKKSDASEASDAARENERLRGRVRELESQLTTRKAS